MAPPRSNSRNAPGYVCPKRKGRGVLLTAADPLISSLASQFGLSVEKVTDMVNGRTDRRVHSDHPPPIRWQSDRLPDENPAQFIIRAYAAEIAAGTLHKGIIRQVDPQLFASLTYWLRANDMPTDLTIPSPSEWKMSNPSHPGYSPPSYLEGLATGPREHWDVFLSHASEDKDTFVRPLAQALRTKGVSVWFDEMTLKVGDSLRRNIDQGLAHSRFGVVIISPHFLSKEWPQRELDGLTARETAGKKIILPVWHNVDMNIVANYSPVLADRLATNSAKGLDVVVRELLAAMSIKTTERAGARGPRQRSPMEALIA